MGGWVGRSKAIGGGGGVLPAAITGDGPVLFVMEVQGGGGGVDAGHNAACSW